MARQKLPAATDWENRNIDDWNATTFRAYFGHKHHERFGIPYEPFGNWGMESAKYKQAYTQYGKPTIKRFIDEQIAAYKPTKSYPGTSFGFLYTYYKPELQRAAAAIRKEAERAEMETNTNMEEWEW